MICDRRVSAKEGQRGHWEENARDGATRSEAKRSAEEEIYGCASPDLIGRVSAAFHAASLPWGSCFCKSL